MFGPSPSGFASRSALPPAVRALLYLTVGAFFLQWAGDQLLKGGFTRLFSLSLAGVRSGEFWQPVTYLFLHGGIWHLVLNMIGLFFFGPETERYLGMRRFVALYLGCGILAGLGWLLISGVSVGFCLGASGAVFGVLAAFAGLFPDRPVTLLLFFVLPVSMTARTLAIGLGVFTLASMTLDSGNIAYAAHLVGGLAGYAYARFGVRRGGLSRTSLNPRQWYNDLVWKWQRRKFKVLSRTESASWAATDTNADADAGQPAEDDVDKILEKIAREGIFRLTRREREILDQASRKRR